jgi:hypothetical protein
MRHSLPHGHRWFEVLARQSNTGDAMAPTKIMLIRHAEKPDETGTLLGVGYTGTPDPNQLSVRGWQRAGALVRFFAPAGQELPKDIATPSAIFACKPENGTYSVRPFSTVLPLATLLGIEVNHQIGKCDIAALLNAVGDASGAVLICWSHDTMPAIVRALTGEIPGLPAKWPGKRFDLIWGLDRVDAGWSFYQRGQWLLPGDADPVQVSSPERQVQEFVAPA